MLASPDDVAALTALLGRPPSADFEVVVRGATNGPAVIRNAPLTRDGTPMPTRYWLVDRELASAVSRLPSSGGVRDAHAAPHPPPPPAPPRPHGGVGGTRTGVKCLHAHYASYLVDGTDPIGAWVASVLALQGRTYADPVTPKQGEE